MADPGGVLPGAAPPPAPDWSLGSFATGTVQLATAAIVAADADALLAVGALPPESAVLTGLPGSVGQ